jgi:hypothetical protein
MKKPDRKIKLEVHMGHIPQPSNEYIHERYYGFKGKPDHHLIEVHTGLPIIKQIMALCHGFGHFLVAIFLPHISLDVEHAKKSICETLERAGRRGFKNILEGK